MQVENFFSPAAVSGSLSIDRCTFLLFSPRLSLWASDTSEYNQNLLRLESMSNLIKKELADVLDPDFPQGYPSQLFRYHFRTADGVDIQMGSQMPKRLKIDDLSYLEAFGTDEEKEAGAMFKYVPNDYAFRVEYNPNSTSLNSVGKLLGNFSRYQSGSTVRIARLDIAIDFKASIVPELVLCSGMRKSFTASGSKGLESLYFGTRQSKNYVRLYDKRQERLDKEGIELGYDLWRLELESKEAFFLGDAVPDHGKVFQRFSFYEGAVSSGDWLVDMIRSQAMVYGLQNVLRRMPSRTATRYRKAFKEMVFQQEVEPPSFVYARDFPSAFMRLKGDILHACGFELAQ